MSADKQNIHAGAGDLRTLVSGLIPAGFDAGALTPKGRDEVRDALDVILKLWDYRNARLTLALEQLDKAAVEIERLRLEIIAIGIYDKMAYDGPAGTAKPAWVPFGNSLKQDEARQIARDESASP